MRFDKIATPISAEEPCGPDLDEEGDDAYLNYVLSAAGRIPESFYQRDPNAPLNNARYVPFDRTKIDLKTETKAIAALLGRTLDLRLLTLDARFHCLAGQIVGFCEDLQAMGLLVERHWDAVHPRGADGDFTMRQNTLSGLDDQSSVLLPLGYAPLVVSRKSGGVSLRDHLIANGTLTARPDDRKIDASDILDAFQSPDARPAVEELHGAVTGALDALDTMYAKFVTEAGNEFSPSYTNLAATLGQIRELIETANPDMVAAAPSEEAEPVPVAEETGEASHQQAISVPGPALALPDHAAASAALLAVEQYFAHAEPSSPALILIHQARMLVGKPLVEALEILMPDAAAKAVITFTGGPAFRLDMGKMKALTGRAINGGAVSDGEGQTQSFSVASRHEAEALIASVDMFFKAKEPSSPIPMLIGRARTYLNRDFATILADLIKPEAQAPPAAAAPKTN